MSVSGLCECRIAFTGGDNAYRRSLHRGFLTLLVSLFSEAIPPHPALRLSFSVGQPSTQNEQRMREQHLCEVNSEWDCDQGTTRQYQVWRQIVRKWQAAQHGLQPTRLSRLEFEVGFVVVGGSGQSGTLQTRLAAEPNR